MTNANPAGPELQHAVEQFYYAEAQLLDGRQYKSWLALCSESIRYVMPARTNPLIDNAQRGKPEMITIDRELDGLESDGLPTRDERHLHLAMRVERAVQHVLHVAELGGVLVDQPQHVRAFARQPPGG